MTAARSGVDGLWAITSYFNPLGYRRRLENYRHFRERLSVPLLAVELGYRPDFELGEGDADVLVQLRGTDVMWQKERLLNIALKALPEPCTKVAWIDCDVIFKEENWAESLKTLLDKHMIVQAFSRVYHLPHGIMPENTAKRPASTPSTAYVMSECKGAVSKLGMVEGDNFAGLAWAARRELLEEHGFYDTNIAGGGDRAMIAAACGHSNIIVGAHRMTDRHRDRYLSWAVPFQRSVGGAVGYREGELFHLWHGALTNRRLRERHERINGFAFNPYEDIRLGANGVWRWASDKPELHAYLRDYFTGRQEDL